MEESVELLWFPFSASVWLHGYTRTDWVSENVAAGPRTGADVVALWMSDEGHKAVILTVDAPYNSHRERLLRNREAGQVPGQGAATTPSAPRRGSRRTASSARSAAASPPTV